MYIYMYIYIYMNGVLKNKTRTSLGIKNCMICGLQVLF